MRLYIAPQTCSLAPHLALEYAGAQYEISHLHFGNNQQRSPEYLAINPKGRVPALVTDRGILTETPAILVFIAQSYPQAELAPLHDAYEFAKLQEFQNYLSSTVHVAHAHRPRGARWVDDPAALEAMRRKVPQNMAECFELIERDYVRGPWVFGEKLSLADFYLFAIAQWLEADGVEPARFPKVQALQRRLEADPRAQRVLAQQSPPA
jgi:glutathione S-transferase